MIVKLVELLKDMSDATNISIKVVKQGHGAVEVDITGKNVNKALGFGGSVIQMLMAKDFDLLTEEEDTCVIEYG